MNAPASKTLHTGDNFESLRSTACPTPFVSFNFEVPRSQHNIAYTAHTSAASFVPQVG
jgi:hypothetical protein